MYNINTKTDKPDIGLMEYRVLELMKRGIKVDTSTGLVDYYRDMASRFEADIMDKYCIVNVNSSKQVINFIKNMANKAGLSGKNDIIDICYNDKTQKWTSNADALEKLADLGYEFATDIIDYRHAKKYADSIGNVIGAADENGYVHSEVSLGKTHRINYSKPAIMTIPKRLLWEVIIPEDKEHSLFSIDIKNQEPAILIGLTGAESLKPALRAEEGLYEYMFKQCFVPKATANVLIDTFMEDRLYSTKEIESIGTISPALYRPRKPEIKDTFYNGERVIAIETICTGSSKGVTPELPNKVRVETETGSMYDLEVEWEEIDKKQINRSNDYEVKGVVKGLDITISEASRKEFKQSWLAISYGASSFGIMEMCKTIDGKTVWNFITKNENLKAYRDKVSKWAKAGNTTIGTAFGNIMDAGYETEWRKLQRILLDLPIQGTGADVLALLIEHFYKVRENNGWTANDIDLYYTRHDEVIIEVSNELIERIKASGSYIEAFLADTFEHQINDWEPFKIEITNVSGSGNHVDDIFIDEDE